MVYFEISAPPARDTTAADGGVLADPRKADSISRRIRRRDAPVEGCAKENYAVLSVIGMGVEN